jgi:hypothetical protein
MQLSTTVHYKDNIFSTQAQTESMFTLTNSMLAYIYNLAPPYHFRDYLSDMHTYYSPIQA